MYTCVFVCFLFFSFSPRLPCTPWFKGKPKGTSFWGVQPQQRHTAPMFKAFGCNCLQREGSGSSGLRVLLRLRGGLLLPSGSPRHAQKPSRGHDKRCTPRAFGVNRTSHRPVQSLGHLLSLKDMPIFPQPVEPVGPASIFVT